jgi:hypothetical protein
VSLLIEGYAPAPLAMLLAHGDASFLHEFLAQSDKSLVLAIGLEHPD